MSNVGCYVTVISASNNVRAATVSSTRRSDEGDKKCEQNFVWEIARNAEVETEG